MQTTSPLSLTRSFSRLTMGSMVQNIGNQLGKTRSHLFSRGTEMPFKDTSSHDACL